MKEDAVYRWVDEMQCKSRVVFCVVITHTFNFPTHVFLSAGTAQEGKKVSGTASNLRSITFPHHSFTKFELNVTSLWPVAQGADGDDDKNEDDERATGAKAPTNEQRSEKLACVLLLFYFLYAIRETYYHNHHFSINMKWT